MPALLRQLRRADRSLHVEQRHPFLGLLADPRTDDEEIRG